MSEETWLKEFYPVHANKVPEKKAIKHSLQKWYGLRQENLKKHGIHYPPIEINGSSCALCKQYFNAGCVKCPLAQFNGRQCDESDGENFSLFFAYDWQDDPEPMIAALEAIEFVERTCK
jgi:hypothetical protein